MANIIASGSTELASADFTLAAGESTTLFFTSASSDEPGGLAAKVQIKAGSAYTTIGYLKSGEPAKQLTGPGTFRVVRLASGSAAAVERI